MGGPVQMVELDGVLVTPWHPVRRVDGAWSFPSTLAAPSAHEVEAVYTLLLEEGPTTSFAIGGWDAVALGHGLAAEPCAHPFFGSREAVLASLKPMTGWVRGHVVLGPDACLRGEDGRVCGWRVDQEVTRPPAGGVCRAGPSLASFAAEVAEVAAEAQRRGAGVCAGGA